MPTKDERIKSLEEKVASLEEQLKLCKMVTEGRPVVSSKTLYPKTEETIAKIVEDAVKPTETASPKPQPATSSTASSDTKQS